MDDLRAYLIINSVIAIPKNRVPRLLREFGGPRGVLAGRPHDWAARGGLTRQMALRLDEARRAFPADKEIDRARRAGIRIMTRDDADYPAHLGEIHDPPCVLYVKGAFTPDDANAVAVVGSRNASYYGLSVARDFAAGLAAFGLTVVSGMARGIDTAAHRAALDAQGRTIAVIGSGLMNIYPAENERLAAQIAGAGALVSEFPLDTAPLAQNFPVRNRIVSGLSRGVLVVEASLRSGALITARCAAEQGRDVFAIPGKLSSATSDGAHDLIKNGAHMVTAPEEILRELRGVVAPARLSREPGRRPPRRPEGALSEEERRVLAVLDDEPKHIDDICRETGTPAGRAAGVLLGLEMKAAVRQVPGKMFVAAGRI
ncbi:MAG: DNA-processing protein DprA [Deltaproteobacteria bacterium]